MKAFVYTQYGPPEVLHLEEVPTPTPNDRVRLLLVLCGLPVIDRRYPFEQIVAAHRYVDTGRKKGNVVVTL